QYFTVPHLFLQDSCRNPVIPVEFRWNPAGIRSFRWNSSVIPVIPVEFRCNSGHSCGILQEFHWNQP
ncbi:hypothetical protein K443DRAFT_117180, partial [Laccaria amethystina LaAM-08-1]